MIPSIRFKTAAAALCVLALAACGRAGDPELPPAQAPSQTGEQAPQQQPATDRPFILDPLLN